MSQFHFDPATYLELMRTEVPLYDDLQQRVARATASVDAADLLDLGTGTGETLAQVLPFHPSARTIGLDESRRHAGRGPYAPARLQRAVLVTFRRAALFWLLAGGGAGLYLFGMDVLYDLEHGIWGKGADGATELAINVLTLALSLFVLRWSWVHHAELLEPSAVSP